jgi:hypothetical protein
MDATALLLPLDAGVRLNILSIVPSKRSGPVYASVQVAVDGDLANGAEIEPKSSSQSSASCTVCEG